MMNIHRQSLLFVALLFVGCVQLPNGLKIQHAELTRIEEEYLKHFDIENNVSEIDFARAISNGKLLITGIDTPDIHPPGWLLNYHQLSQSIDAQFSTESDKERIRRYLIKRIGVVSQLVKVPRDSVTRIYVSGVDRFAFSPEEIRSICSGSEVNYSRLAKLVLLQSQTR